MAELLNDAEVSDALRELPDWSRDADALVLTAALPSFPAAISVVDRVAELAEQANHHPDIDIRWRNLTFRCSTHSAGGLTELDVRLARDISGVVRAAQE